MRWERGMLALLAGGLVLLVIIGGLDIMYWRAATDTARVRSITDPTPDDCTVPILNQLPCGTSFVRKETRLDGSSCKDACLTPSAAGTCQDGVCTGACAGECPLGDDGSSCPDIALNNVSLIYGFSSNLTVSKSCIDGKCWYIVGNMGGSLLPFFIGQSIDFFTYPIQSIEMQRRLSAACMDIVDTTTPGLNSKCLVSSWINLNPSSPGGDICFYTFGCAHYADFAYSTNPDLGLLAASKVDKQVLVETIQQNLNSGNYVQL
jgi:hypothetical protein